MYEQISMPIVALFKADLPQPLRFVTHFMTPMLQFCAVWLYQVKWLRLSEIIMVLRRIGNLLCCYRCTTIQSVRYETHDNNNTGRW